MENTNTPLVKRALFNALGTISYISLVALFMQNAEKIFGQVDNDILAPIAMLMLFVISASITGSLVLGKPILLYFEGKKREGISLFILTLGFMAVLLIIVFISLFLLRQS